MAKKFVVYISYGVYVDYPDGIEIDENDDEDYDQLKRDAVAKMWSHGQNEVGLNCEIDLEDVTEEFKEVN